MHDATGADNGCTKYPRDIEIPEGTEVVLKACLQNGADGRPQFCNIISGWA